MFTPSGVSSGTHVTSVSVTADIATFGGNANDPWVCSDINFVVYQLAP